MRMNFLVHTYINIILWDPVNKVDIVGCRLKERTIVNKKSHLLTIDKIVCEMPLTATFNQDQTAESNEENIK